MDGDGDGQDDLPGADDDQDQVPAEAHIMRGGYLKGQR